jgi:hypothetical protein
MVVAGRKDEAMKRKSVIAGVSTFLVAACLALAGQTAEAGSVTINGTSTGGRAISAKLDWTLGSGFIDLTLTNLTSATNSASAAELLVKVDFLVNATSGATSLTTATGQVITLDGSGNRTSSSSGASIKDDSNWFVDTTGFSGVGRLALDWNVGGNPEYGIIGGELSTTSYPNANGSILTDSHQPLVQKLGTFRISNSNFSTTMGDLSDVRFYFNTTRDLVTAVPLPPAAWAGLGMLGGLGALSVLRRRRRTEI